MSLAQIPDAGTETKGGAMNENWNEAQDLPVEFKPWYRRKRVRIVGALLVLALSVSIAIHRYLQYRKWYSCLK
jgi:hypothetical protein